jgi:hypothetical protein
MKTKTFFLICLFLGIGITRLSAQTDVYKWADVPGLCPLTCDGVNVEWLNATGTLTWLSHYEKDKVTGEIKWAWVKAHYKWTATSTTGEVFKATEMDPAIEIYNPVTGDYIKEVGFWHFIAKGNMGSHYNVTYSYSYDQLGNWTWEFVEAKCH